MTHQKIRLLNLNKNMDGSTPNKKSESKPKKEKASKKKNTPPNIVTTPTLPSLPINSNNSFDVNIAQVIRDAIRVQMASKVAKQRQVDDEIDAMVLTYQEFMKSFVILGYNLDGEQIPPIIVANNQQEADAIGNYLQKFLQHIVRNDGNLGTLE